MQLEFTIFIQNEYFSINSAHDKKELLTQIKKYLQ